MNRPNGNQLKKEIRSKMPELNHRDISIKYDGSYRIKIKKFVPLSKVKKVAEVYESYRTCQATGEILSGGNTFVFVDYSYKNIEVPEEIIQEIKEILLSYLGDSWKCGDYRSRSYHITRAIQEKCKTFNSWSVDDVRDVLSVLEDNCPELYDWINGNFHKMNKYQTLKACA